MDEVRKPRLTEVVAMKALLDEASAAGQVLPRQLPELYENVRDFHVYADDSGVGGLVAALVVAGINFLVLPSLVHSNKVVAVPDLRGATPDAAADLPGTAA